MTTPSTPPQGWDRLDLAPDADDPAAASPPPSAPATRTPPILTVVAAAWGDLVTVLAVGTAALGAIAIQGHTVAARSLPWALGLGVVWWLFATLVLLVVRRGTPGMLLSGIALKRPLHGARLWVAVGAAMVSAGTLGVAALGGARRSLVAVACGSPLVHSEDDAG